MTWIIFIQYKSQNNAYSNINISVKTKKSLQLSSNKQNNFKSFTKCLILGDKYQELKLEQTIKL
jgi:hypothetical protein